MKLLKQTEILSHCFHLRFLIFHLNYILGSFVFKTYHGLLPSKLSGILSLKDIQRTTHTLIKIIHLQAFKTEFEFLLSIKSMHSKSKLLSFYAFLDKNGLLRVGRRVRNSFLMLLTCNDFYYHQNMSSALEGYSHQFRSSITVIFEEGKVLAEHGRNADKKVVQKCRICFKSHPQNPLLDDLLKYRDEP